MQPTEEEIPLNDENVAQPIDNDKKKQPDFYETSDDYGVFEAD